MGAGRRPRGICHTPVQGKQARRHVGTKWAWVGLGGIIEYLSILLGPMTIPHIHRLYVLFLEPRKPPKTQPVSTSRNGPKTAVQRTPEQMVSPPANSELPPRWDSLPLCRLGQFAHSTETRIACPSPGRYHPWPNSGRPNSGLPAERAFPSSVESTDLLNGHIIR